MLLPGRTFRTKNIEILFKNDKLKVTDQNIGIIDHIILLETFYRAVLKKEVLSFIDTIFPGRNDVTGRMVHIPGLNYNEMMENIAIYFGCNKYRYKKDDKVQKMQQRPGWYIYICLRRNRWANS